MCVFCFFCWLFTFGSDSRANRIDFVHCDSLDLSVRAPFCRRHFSITRESSYDFNASARLPQCKHTGDCTVNCKHYPKLLRIDFQKFSIISIDNVLPMWRPNSIYHTLSFTLIFVVCIAIQCLNKQTFNNAV